MNGISNPIWQSIFSPIYSDVAGATGGSIYTDINLLAALLDPRITFTRASPKTYVGSTGLISTAANDVDPLEYDTTTLAAIGRSFWASRTNLQTYSQDFDNAIWLSTVGGTGVTPVVTANYAIAPDGTLTADRIQLSIGAGTLPADICQIIGSGISGLSVSSIYTDSVWMKTNDGSSSVINFPPIGGASNNLITVTPSWQRFTISAAASSTSLPGIRFRLRGSESTSKSSDLSVWGAQRELGTFVGPYIATTAASVTRAADVATINTLSSIGFNASAGTFIITHTVSATRSLLGSGANSIAVSQGGHKLAVAYDGAGSYICKDGGSVTTAAALTFSSSLSLGQISINYANGNIASIRYYPIRLPDAQLQALTT